MRTWRDVARRYALSEYDGPPLEPLDLYTRKSGEEIVGQLYHFEDKGGRAVALRPEMTPTLARMVGERANAMRKPVRWFSVPQLFRYERQQRGRLREHFQLNVDIVGEADVTADAELLAVAIDVMRGFGLTRDDVRARVSDRRLLAALLRRIGVTEGALPAVYAVIDRLERDARHALEQRLEKAGIPGATARTIFDVVGAGEIASLRSEFGRDADIAEQLDGFERYLGFLEALGVRDWVRFDLSIVRGLAYYTGIVFELFDAQGEFRAICGGGRYDTLLAALGGTDLPALGFGMGDVVLGELLHARGLMPDTAPTLDYWVAGSEDDSLHAVMAIASALRARGRSVEYALRPQALGRQLRAAAAAGARSAVIVPAGIPAGAPESGSLRVKHLADGTEETVRLDEWLPHA